MFLFDTLFILALWHTQPPYQMDTSGHFPGGEHGQSMKPTTHFFHLEPRLGCMELTSTPPVAQCFNFTFVFLLFYFVVYLTTLSLAQSV
jgi:hypothetical protein